MKPLTQQTLDELAAAHKASLDALRKSLHAIRAAAEPGYPTSASTVPKQPSNLTDENGKHIQPSSKPEALALNPDPEAAEATRILQLIDVSAYLSDKLAVAARRWMSDRPTDVCPECKYPLDRGTTRCQRVINGSQCGATADTARYCDRDKGGCGEMVAKGEPRRNGLCNKCRARRDRANRKAAERGSGTIDIKDMTGIKETPQ